MLKKNKGVSLIVLIVTIAILMILGTIVISTDTFSLVTRASGGVFKYSVKNMQSELENYCTEQISATEGSFDRDNFNLSKEIVDEEQNEEVKTELMAILSRIIPIKYQDMFRIERGELKPIEGQLTETQKELFNGVVSDLYGIQDTTFSVGTTYTEGTEVTFGGEQFYVLGDDQDSVRLLAKYCLSPVALEQTDSTVGFEFSNNNYWSGVEGISYPAELQTNSMLSLLSEEEDELTYGGHVVQNAILRAQKYGTSKGVVGRLMKYQEANTIINSGTDSMKNILFSGGTRFWIGAASSSNSVYVVYENGSLISEEYGSPTQGGPAVRPVLIVPKS